MLPPLPPEDQLYLATPRISLEPVIQAHAQELWDLFKDPELHHFVPFEPISLDKQRERCARWALRQSPQGDELWLNWLARDLYSREAIGHFQVGIKERGIASIGYLVARSHQGQGLATECLKSIFDFLCSRLAVGEIKAWVDTRNLASIRLAEKLGMKRVETLKDADFFKGASSDEFVYLWKSE